MKSRLLGAVCAFAISSISVSANGAVVLFDTTEIFFNASGSANTIGGGWSANLMIVPAGAEVSFFTIEVKALSVSDGYGDPRTILLNTSFNPNPYGYIGLGSEPPFTVTGVGVGSTAVITASTYRSGWELLTHMIEGYREPVWSKYSSVLRYQHLSI